MAVNTKNPVAVTVSPMADYFEIAHIDTSNRDTGIVVDVWWNAYLKNADGSKTLVKNCGPHAIAGDRLLVVSADCLARANAFVAQGVGAGLALQGGYRDAIYAELAHAGEIAS